MTGNRLIDYLLSFNDDDTSVCELLEQLKRNECDIIELCKESTPNLDSIDEGSILSIAKFCTILEYKVGLHRLPSWVSDGRLYCKKALYIGSRLDDFTIAKMFLFAPQAFLNRNIYFNLEGLERF